MWSSFPLPTSYHVLPNPYLSDYMDPGFAREVPYQMIPFNHCLLINALYVPYSNGYSPENSRKFLPNRPSGPMFNKVTLLENSGASGASIAGRCTVDRREVECLPNTVKESLGLLDHPEDVRAMQQVPCNSKAQGWQEGSSNPALYKDFSAQDSASLDAELDHHGHWGTPWPALHSPPSQALHRNPFACTEASRSYYSNSAGEHDNPSEFYSLDSSRPSSSQLNNSGGTYAMQPEWDSSALATARSSEKAWCDGSCPGPAEPAGASSPPFTMWADSRGDPLHCSDSICNAGGPEKDREESSDFHSILEEDGNIVVCKSSGRPEAGAARDRSTGAGGETQQNYSAPGNGGAKAYTVERGTSPSPRVVTCDVSVGTETRCVSVDAQTEVPATEDKNIFTVLHMADLDYLAEEFVKLKSAQKELRELKQQLKSSEEAGEREPCAGCGGRAQRAELRLLALQYTMCQQHAWMDCFTSPDHLTMTPIHAESTSTSMLPSNQSRPVYHQSALSSHRPQDPPAKLVSVSQKLQCDYKEMRTKILAGVSLEQLEPLAVNSARLTSGPPYTPPQIIGDALEDVTASCGPLERRNMETHAGNESPLCPKSEDPKEAKGQEAPVAQSKVNSSNVVSLMPKHSGPVWGLGADNKPTVACVTAEVAVAWQMEGDSTEFSTSEAWYDAKADLDPSAVMVPSGPADIPSGSDDGIKEGLPKKVEEQGRSFLCASELPKHVTEIDVMPLFEKDHVPTEVRLCTFSNHLTPTSSPMLPSNQSRPVYHQSALSSHRPQDPPAKLVSVSQKLQCDCKEMRTKILAGVSLEQLEPLAVNSARLTSGPPYTPPQIIGDALEDVTASCGPLERRNMETHAGNESPLCPKSEDPKEAKGQEAPVAQSKVNSSNVVSLMPKHSGPVWGLGADNKPTVACVTAEVAVAWQMEGDSTEFSTSEAWYDAKVDLDPSAVMVPSGPADIPSGSDDGIKEGLPKKVEEQGSSFLCASELPKHVTEIDVMQLFEKDHVPTEVSLCTFSNQLTVAIVTVNGPLTAELVVGKMNGVCMQGSTLHVEHIKPEAESLSLPQQHPISSSHVPEETGDAAKPSATKTNSSITVGTVPGSGPDSHRVLSASPTAEGTCVPQHFATMGSFDKLMAQLKERHPEAGRKAIVAALLEVKTRHRCVLRGLSLSCIEEMASKQLAASSSGATAPCGGSGGGGAGGDPAPLGGSMGVPQHPEEVVGGGIAAP